MSDDEKKEVVETAFARLAGRIFSASSSLNEGTRTAIRNTLRELRTHIEGDPEWVSGVVDAKRLKDGNY